jgi:hypothetical protein
MFKPFREVFMHIRLLVTTFIACASIFKAYADDNEKRTSLIFPAMERGPLMLYERNYSEVKSKFYDRCLVDDFATKYLWSAGQNDECLKLIQSAKALHALLHPDQKEVDPTSLFATTTQDRVREILKRAGNA